MNKKLLTVAIGAALGAAPMFAAADVKVYGHAQVEYVQVQNDGAVNITPPGNGNAVNAQTDASVLNDAIRGRVGVLADEDLGGGLKGVAKVEFIVDFADGGAGNGASGSPFAARDLYLGLESKTFGSLRFGNFNGPYKETGAAIDPYIASNLEARNNYGMSGNADGYGVMNGHSNFLRNAIRYTSPSFVGIQADVLVGVDGVGGLATTCGVPTGTTTAGATFNGCGQADQTNGDISASVGWKGGPAYVFVAYNKMANVTTTAASKPEPTAKKIGAQVKLGGGNLSHTINAQFEKTDRDVASTTTWGAEGQYIFLGYHLGIGGFTVSLQGGAFEDDVNTEGLYYMVAGKYNFSKTTSAWIGYRHTELENSSLTNSTVLGNVVDKIRDENYYGIGLRKDF